MGDHAFDWTTFDKLQAAKKPSFVYDWLTKLEKSFPAMSKVSKNRPNDAKRLHSRLENEGRSESESKKVRRRHFQAFDPVAGPRRSPTTGAHLHRPVRDGKHAHPIRNDLANERHVEEQRRHARISKYKNVRKIAFLIKNMHSIYSLSGVIECLGYIFESVGRMVYRIGYLFYFIYLFIKSRLGLRSWRRVRVCSRRLRYWNPKEKRKSFWLYNVSCPAWANQRRPFTRTSTKSRKIV